MSPELFGQTFAGAALVVFIYMNVWFVTALVSRRNDIVDIAWGLGFIAIVIWLLVRDDAPLSTPQYIVSTLVGLWGLRLAWHIGKRNLRPGRPEDSRYAAWRASWGRWFVPRTYLQVFMLQGLLMVVVASPILVVGSAEGAAMNALVFLGIAVWVLGFGFEVVGDAQLARFVSDPANRGHTMESGLWSWTRHPNYFGEAVSWWGIGLIAVSTPGGWIGLIGPITITFLLTKVSGVPMAESRRTGNPEWEAYKARTSAFIPLPPRGEK